MYEELRLVQILLVLASRVAGGASGFARYARSP